MNSMTGFGKGELSMDGKTVTVELKSVNHRFLDLYFRLPSTLSFAEDYIRNTLKNAFARGHIECSVSFNACGTSSRVFTVDESAAASYFQLAEKLSQSLGIQNDIKVSNILSYPAVIVEKKDETSVEELQLMLSLALSSAIESLSEMRAKEGESLKKVLVNHLEVVSEAVEAASMRAPLVVDDYREKLKQRITDFLGEMPDEARLLTEVAFYSDKINVDEELNRLRSHIDQFTDLLESNAACGKKLDFLIQEMNREVNTLGSKANDTELRGYVLDLKNELEKIREQIQNIE